MPVTFYSVIPSEAKRSRGISSCSFFYEEIRDVSTMLDMTEERWHGHVCFRPKIGLWPVAPHRKFCPMSRISELRIRWAHRLVKSVFLS
jgi:hypothetical protein